MHPSNPKITNNFLALLYVMILIVWIVNISIALTALNTKKTAVEGMYAPFSTGTVQLCSAEVPTITGTSYHEIQQDYPYLYDFNATGETGGGVNFTDNTTIFNITSDTGIVDFTPRNGDVGVYYVMIAATETICNSFHDEIHATFNITNINDAPYMISIVTENASSPGTNTTYNLYPGPVWPYLKIISGQVELWEDETYNLSIIADDPDFYIPFSAELIEYDVLPPDVLFVLNNDTGKATFTPVQSEVGTYSFKFFVDDGETAEETAFITFVVNNVNDAPVMENKTLLTIRTANSGEPFYFDMNATDQDGDILTYGADFLDCNQTFRNATSQNCTIFYPDPMTGAINFTPLLDEVGNYTVNYTVHDGNGGSDWHIGNFTIIEIANHPPNITDWEPFEYNVTLYEGQSIGFNITVVDPDSGTNTVSTAWLIDGQLMAEDVYSYTVSTSYDDSGVYNVTVVANDGHYLMPLSDWHEWNLIVLDKEPPSPVGRRKGMFAGLVCVENWRCTAWSDCPKEGVQTRVCIDLSGCGTTINQPQLTKYCIYTPNPDCYDGIANCHDGSCEILTDCGGPCSPCPTCSDGLLNCHVTGVCEEGVDCGGPAWSRRRSQCAETASARPVSFMSARKTA